MPSLTLTTIHRAPFLPLELAALHDYVAKPGASLSKTEPNPSTLSLESVSASDRQADGTLRGLLATFVPTYESDDPPRAYITVYCDRGRPEC